MIKSQSPVRLKRALILQIPKLKSQIERILAELKERSQLLGKSNTASIPTRYPDDLQCSLKEYTKSVAKEYLNQT